MPTKLTDAKIAELTPRDVQYETRDVQDGLRVVVFPSGKKSFVFRYRYFGLSRKLTIGSVAIGIAEARRIAKKNIGFVADRKDPAGDRRKEKAATKQARKDVIDAALIEFMQTHTKTRKGRPIRMTTRIETGRLLGLKPDPDRKNGWIASGKGVLDRWRGKSVHAVTRQGVESLLKEIKESGPVTANRTLAALKTFFRWRRLDKNPCDDLVDPSGEEARSRVLSDSELAALWRATDAQGYPFGPMAKMLVLTGCRRDEVREALWAEFNLPKREWLIPGHRTKNSHEHLLPVTDMMSGILEAIPRIKGKAGLLFTTTGETPISGLAKYKRRLHEAMARELGKEPERWTLHDIRRSVSTGMHALGIPPHHVEACLNHRSGTRAGVAGTYNRYEYAAEKAEAFAKWARHVEAIVTGKPAKVIPLRPVAAGA